MDTKWTHQILSKSGYELSRHKNLESAKQKLHWFHTKGSILFSDARIVETNGVNQAKIWDPVKDGGLK